MQQDDTGDRIVRLAKPRDLHEAEFIRAELERQAISCRVVGDLLSGVEGLGGHISPIEVWVHERDLERATTVLNDLRRTE
jgi:hypothetical protein